MLITLPRRSSRRLADPAVHDVRAAILDRALWPVFLRAPDMVEGSVDVHLEITWSQWDDWTGAWLSPAPAARTVEAGDARVGVSAADELVVVAARQPGWFPADAAFE